MSIRYWKLLIICVSTAWVSQGSILCLLLFILYTTPLSTVKSDSAAEWADYHLYADYTQRLLHTELWISLMTSLTLKTLSIANVTKQRNSLSRWFCLKSWCYLVKSCHLNNTSLLFLNHAFILFSTWNVFYWSIYCLYYWYLPIKLIVFNLSKTLLFVQSPCKTPNFHRITPSLKSLHWLKINERIKCKIQSLSHI